MPRNCHESVYFGKMDSTTKDPGQIAVQHVWYVVRLQTVTSSVQRVLNKKLNYFPKKVVRLHSQSSVQRVPNKKLNYFPKKEVPSISGRHGDCVA
jgi:hypothetical protein